MESAKPNVRHYGVLGGFMNSIRALVFVLSLSLFASACSKNGASKPANPVLRDVDTQEIRDDRPSLAPGIAASKEIQVTAIVDKKALLSQEFLYGADLQYSSLYDKAMDLYQQSLALGHIPAHFSIVGDELQLIADNRKLYPSEVNHPAQLITRFKIVAQTEDTLTIHGADSHVYLAEIFGATVSDSEGKLISPEAKPTRDHWIRSFEFAPQGNYLLQQTSVVLDDGTVAEFMESIFPRSTLAAGDQFRAIEMNPEDPTECRDQADSKNNICERYRLLDGQPQFDGERKFAMAEHFDISRTPANPTGTIDWYVTPNIPEEAMIPVQTAVEGWNRYFNKFKGVERDVVLFKGRLPEGIHLGDPRYNVINWDSRLIAGAAYESQAVDPATGKMSHSLIYMPAAWMQIGLNYWKNGQFTEQSNESVAPPQLAKLGGAVSKARLTCLRDVRAAGALLASGRVAAENSSPAVDPVQEFGKRLLKTTLFHEVGHALGLAHNFKGSLSYDRKETKATFSTSIMDYNDYEIEVVAFDAVDSANGPALEYDRQVLNQLYNKGNDVSAEAAKLPVCNDEEADKVGLGGVDPLCLRYDLERDPTLSIATALDRIQLEAKPGDVTMSQSIARVPGLLLTPSTLSAVTTPDQLVALSLQVGSSLKGAMQFYLTAGKASLARVVRLNVKSLYRFENEILEDGYDEQAMRDRAYTGVQKALALNVLPSTVHAALVQAEKDTLEALVTTPALQGLSKQDAAELLGNLGQVIHNLALSIEKDPAAGLPAVRAAVLTALARQPAPFFLGKSSGAVLNVEANVVGILGDALTGADNATRAPVERLAAARSLMSFAGRLQGEPAIAAAKEAVLKSRAAATDNDSLELAQALLQILQQAK